MASFEFLLFLSAIILLSSLFFQTRLTQLRARQLVDARTANFRQSPLIPWINRPLKRQQRPVRWISCEELRKILQENSHDLIVLDLRAETQGTPFPLPEVFVLSIRPDELLEILDWMPSRQCVVFYGIRDPWISAIEKSSSMAGAAPFYFLDDGDRHRKTA